MQGNGRQAQYNIRSMCFEWTTLFPLEPDIYVSSQVTSSTRILWASHFLVCVFWKNFPLGSARLLTCTPCPKNCESVRQCRWTGCYCTLSPYQNSPCWNIIALYTATPFSKKKSASHPSIANSLLCVGTLIVLLYTNLKGSFPFTDPRTVLIVVVSRLLLVWTPPLPSIADCQCRTKTMGHWKIP